MMPPPSLFLQSSREREREMNPNPEKFNVAEISAAFWELRRKLEPYHLIYDHKRIQFFDNDSGERPNIKWGHALNENMSLDAPHHFAKVYFYKYEDLNFELLVKDPTWYVKYNFKYTRREEDDQMEGYGITMRTKYCGILEVERQLTLRELSFEAVWKSGLDFSVLPKTLQDDYPEIYKFVTLKRFHDDNLIPAENFSWECR